MARSSQSDSTSHRQKKKCNPEKPKPSQDKVEDKCGSSVPANPAPTRAQPHPYYGTEGVVAKIREKSTKNVNRIRNILKNMNILLKTVDEMELQCCKNRYRYDRSTDPYDPDPNYEYDDYDYSYYDANSPHRRQQEYCQYGGRYGNPEGGGRKGYDNIEDGLPGGDSPFGQPRPRCPDREYDRGPSPRGKEETFGSGSGDDDMPEDYGRRPPTEPRSREGPRRRRPQNPGDYGGYGFNPPRTKPGDPENTPWGGGRRPKRPREPESRGRSRQPRAYDSPDRRDGGPEYGSPGGRPRGPPGGNRRGSPMGYVQQDSKLEACRDWQPRGREERRGDFGNRSPRRDDYGGSAGRGSGGCGPGGCRPRGRGEPGGDWPRGRGPGGRGDHGSHGEHGGHKPEYRGGPRDGYRRGDNFNGSSGFSGSSDDELGRYPASNKMNNKDSCESSKCESDRQFRYTRSSKSRSGRYNIFDGEPDKRKIVGTECDPYFYTQMSAVQINQHIKEEAKDGFLKGKKFYMPFTYWLLKSNNTNTIKILPLLIKPPRHMQNKFTFRYVKDFYDSEPLLLPHPETDGRDAADFLLQIKDEWKFSKKQVQDKVNECLNLAMRTADNNC